MTCFCLLQMFFILLCTMQISTPDCNIPSLQQSKAIQSSLHLLDKIGQAFPLQCRREHVLFKFPHNILKLSQKDNVKVAVQETLQSIFYMFSKNLTLAAWDGRSLESFQNGLYQQIEQLEACSIKKIKKKPQYLRDVEANRLKLKKYFQRIDNFLKGKQYSLCSWEIIREEVRKCLQLIEKGLEGLENKLWIQAKIKNLLNEQDSRRADVKQKHPKCKRRHQDLK
ncbi:interferon alpha-2 isoform X1 [Alligator mississippiensis]|uniref:Interferon type B-like n=1 Tax=Alligator mississippiensis TaxID=8496 RepID=A0A151LZB2_ALLMI|nr:interferon alpha-2 isoform X1 [Alligator mississippiensis]KYO17583.1 interferon type B-like [Alligator mississippiensis]